MGRTAAGVRGIRLPEGEEVISLIIPDPDGLILTASENGYGKLTPVEEFPLHGRGGQGVIAMQTTERNGRLVARHAGRDHRRADADELERHAGAHPRRRDLGARPQHAGRAADPARRRRAA